MNKLVAIDNETHNKLAIDSSQVAQHGAHLNLVPIVPAEFKSVASQYPIVITKSEDTGQFSIVAMTGFEQGENLFFQNGQWQGLYLPLQIQRQPFFIGDLDEKKDGEFLVCFDQTSPAISSIIENDSNTHAVFNSDGSESDYFIHAKQCLIQLAQGEHTNQEMLKTLIELDLIQSMSLEVTFINEENKRLNGLYTINKERLDKLSQEQIFGLHQVGMLEAIYTMYISLEQIYNLIEKKNQALG